MINSYFVFKTILILIITIFPVSAQVQTTEAEAIVQKRAEEFLETIRLEHWNEIYKFVIVSTGKFDKKTRLIMNIPENATEEEAIQKVGEFFKKVYGKKKPGRVLSVSIWEKDKTIAGIAYHHGDKDGFTMKFVDGDWYYTFDR